MLSAFMNNGVKVVLALQPSEKVEMLKKQSFYCPECGQKVMMKVGNKVIPHFAHYHLNECHLNHQGESDYHEKGKLDLYNWLLHQNIPCEIEVFLPKIMQRADILFKWQNRYFALEFQCATISLEMLQKRSTSYLSMGIFPIWILGEKRINKSGKNYFHLTSFEFSCFYQWKALNLMIYLYNPENKMFTIFTNPYPISKKVYGMVASYPLPHMKINQLFQSKSNGNFNIYNHWLFEKHKFRRFRGQFLSAGDRNYLNWLYSKGLHPQHLPAIIHLPVAHQLLFTNQTYHWQSQIVLDILEPLEQGSKIPIHRLEKIFRQQLKRVRFDGKPYKGNPVIEYLELLSKINVLKKIDNDFTKMVPIHYPKTFDEAIFQDKLIIRQIKDRIL